MPAKKIPVEKQRKGITVSLTPELVRRLTAAAKREDLSRSQLMARAARAELERLEAKAA